MRATIAMSTPLRLPRRLVVCLVGGSLGLLTAACGQDLERREFGDQYVPPADTLGNVSGGGPDDDDDDGGVPGDDGSPGNADDGGPVDGGEDGSDPDDGGPDDSSFDDDGGQDDSSLDDGADDGSADGDPPPSDDGGGPMESPYTGGWDIGDCQNDITATGTSVGDVLADFTLLDQNGDMVRLYDFCHKAVWLIEGAFW